MRRLSRGKYSKEGYRWLRLQESKSLTIFFVTLVVFTLTPFYSTLEIDPINHSVLALLTGILAKYLLTEFYIAAEEDGIYLEINKKKHVKLMGWDELNYEFLTNEKASRSFGLHNKNIVLIKNDVENVIHQPLCKKMDSFFLAACIELHDINARNKSKCSFI